jgi:hypothetical protein
MARIKMEADVSFVIFLDPQPNTKDSLSVKRITSPPAIFAGQHKNGRSMPTASKVEDLHP